MTSGRWEHSNDLRDRLVARAIGLRVIQVQAGYLIVNRKRTHTFSGPWMFRGNARDELARIGHDLIVRGIVAVD